MLLSRNAAKFRSALSLLFELACLASRSPAPSEIISSNQAHRNCELSVSNLIQLPICFRSSLGLFYMFAEPHQWGCVYSQSIYTGKLDYNPQMAAAAIAPVNVKRRTTFALWLIGCSGGTDSQTMPVS
jgi:hypothetical protein